jgi:hypothetical protein
MPNAALEPFLPTKEPLRFEHFPTTMQLFIWRNWGMIPANRLADILECSVQTVRELAVELGLPSYLAVPPEWMKRGYMTILRANWHLLPYEQLLALLGWSAEHLAYMLKEDDALWIKLGRLKPDAPLLKYHPLTVAEKRRTSEIRLLMEAHFPGKDRAPEEHPFDFLARLREPEPLQRRDGEPRREGEIVLDEQWTVLYPADSRHAADFVALFIRGHAERWGVQLAASAAVTAASNAATPADSLHATAHPFITLAIQPDPQQPAESHKLDIQPSRISIDAVDEVGLLRGLLHMERLMAQHGGLYLSPGRIHRRTKVDFRLIYSYFALYGDPLQGSALDPYPDGLLERYARLGVNAIWLQGVLYSLVPFELAPELSEHWRTRIANLRKLCERAAKYGIGVYLYMNEPRAMPLKFFDRHPELKGHSSDLIGANATLCTSLPEVQRMLSDSMARLFTEAPELAGIFTITMSENLTNCYSRSVETNCPRCMHRTAHEVAAEVNRLIAEGVHRAKPEAKVICWTWAWNENRGWTNTVLREAVRLLPDHVSLMCTSENSMVTNVGGTLGVLNDYSISNVGPSDRSVMVWQMGLARGLPAVAKVQFNNSWECSAVPYLPVLPLVERHLRNLDDAGVTGLMLSWTLGGYPSLNLQLAAQYYWSDEGEGGAEAEFQGSRALAIAEYGSAAAPLVLAAWEQFSRAFREFPFAVGVLYQAPQNVGPGNLLHLRPTGYPSSMVGYPYDDLARWRNMYPEDVFENQFKKLADGWEAGLDLLRQARELVPAQLSPAIDDMWNVSLGAYHQFRSAWQQIAFVGLRNQLELISDPASRRQLKQRMKQLAKAELELSKVHEQLMRNDSRIGYEASNHYFLTRQDLWEKVINCDYLMTELSVQEVN